MLIAVTRCRSRRRKSRALPSGRNTPRPGTGTELRHPDSADFCSTERPHIAGYEFFHYYEKRSVGGDFFDYVTCETENRDHTRRRGEQGSPQASTMMGAVINRCPLPSVDGTNRRWKRLDKLNDDVVCGGYGLCFVTYAASILDPQTHQLTIANAGHFAAAALKQRSNACSHVDHANLPRWASMRIWNSSGLRLGPRRCDCALHRWRD